MNIASKTLKGQEHGHLKKISDGAVVNNWGFTLKRATMVCWDVHILYTVTKTMRDFESENGIRNDVWVIIFYLEHFQHFIIVSSMKISRTVRHDTRKARTILYLDSVGFSS